MGRQFRFYLLPSDLDQLLANLRAEYGLRILTTSSDKPEPLELDLATSNYIEIASSGVYSFGQYYLASGADAKTYMFYGDKLQKWHINSEQSELIELSTSDYGSGVLTEGRFYYQKDMLSPDATVIVPKSPDFVRWAESIFRAAKKQLKYSSELEAYIGLQAEVWRQQGGQFVYNHSRPVSKPKTITEMIQ